MSCPSGSVLVSVAMFQMWNINRCCQASLSIVQATLEKCDSWFSIRNDRYPSTHHSKSITFRKKRRTCKMLPQQSEVKIAQTLCGYPLKQQWQWYPRVLTKLSPSINKTSKLIILFQLSNGACAHYIMVSKFQWRPFWLATQRDPQTDGACANTS